MSRKARLLLNKGTGKNGSFGLVLEELMLSRGQSLALLNEKMQAAQASQRAQAQANQRAQAQAQSQGQGQDREGLSLAEGSIPPAGLSTKSETAPLVDDIEPKTHPNRGETYESYMETTKRRK